MAETYHILDIYSLPGRTLATLAYGLRDDSRIKIKLSDADVPLNTLLLAGCFDRLSILAWQNTEAAQSGRGCPKSIMESFLHVDSGAEKFTIEDFEIERNRILKGDE